MNKPVEHYISELLFLHDCIILPEFGGFVGNPQSAKLNKITGVLTPPSKQINYVISLFNSKKVSIATLAKKIEDEVLITDENSPKAIFDKNEIALNFCRTIPKYATKKDYFKHIGIYGYRTETLAAICALPPSENELKERLEQLRWLDNNYQITVGITTYEGVSVDTPKDIKKIKAQMG